MDINKLKKGDKVEYTGTDFLGYDPANKTMTFLRKHGWYKYDVVVEYNGIVMNVRVTEIIKQ